MSKSKTRNQFEFKKYREIDQEGKEQNTNFKNIKIIYLFLIKSGLIYKYPLVLKIVSYNEVYLK